MSASETQILEFWRNVLSAILSVYTHTCTHIHADGWLWTQSEVVAETQMRDQSHFDHFSPQCLSWSKPTYLGSAEAHKLIRSLKGS